MSEAQDLDEAGKAFWQSLNSDFDFEDHERAIVLEAARIKDRLDLLNEAIRRDGVTVTGPQGVKAHPALVEARQQEIALSRLVASLRLPDEHDQRGQRRGGSRGTYAARRAYGKHSTNGG